MLYSFMDVGAMLVKYIYNDDILFSTHAKEKKAVVYRHEIKRKCVIEVIFFQSAYLILIELINAISSLAF